MQEVLARSMQTTIFQAAAGITIDVEARLYRLSVLHVSFQRFLCITNIQGFALFHLGQHQHRDVLSAR